MRRGGGEGTAPWTVAVTHRVLPLRGRWDGLASLTVPVPQARTGCPRWLRARRAVGAPRIPTGLAAPTRAGILPAFVFFPPSQRTPMRGLGTGAATSAPAAGSAPPSPPFRKEEVR